MTTSGSTTTDSSSSSDGDAPTVPDHTLSWWEIQVTDLAVAQKFYGAIFGWTYSPFDESFVICHTPDGQMVGGLVQVDGDAAGRHVRVYFQTSDLEATIERVVAAGGTVLTARGVISEEYGWFGEFRDPSGMTIGLTTSRPAREG